MLETIHEPDTDLITIEVFSTNTHEPAELANAVAEVNSERRVN